MCEPQEVEYPSEYMIYTDGSKSGHRVGASWMLYINKEEKDNRSYTLPIHATVYEAEVTAMKEAMLYVLQNLDRLPSDITFVTDNSS